MSAYVCLMGMSAKLGTFPCRRHEKLYFHIHISSFFSGKGGLGAWSVSHNPVPNLLLRIFKFTTIFFNL